MYIHISPGIFLLFLLRVDHAGWILYLFSLHTVVIGVNDDAFLFGNRLWVFISGLQWH